MICIFLFVKLRYNFRAYLNAKEGKMDKKKKTKRICLRCDREFMSEGIYNRICPNCTNTNAKTGIVQKNSLFPRTGNGSTKKGLADEK